MAEPSLCPVCGRLIKVDPRRGTIRPHGRGGRCQGSFGQPAPAESPTVTLTEVLGALTGVDVAAAKQTAADAVADWLLAAVADAAANGRTPNAEREAGARDLATAIRRNSQGLGRVLERAGWKAW